MTERDFVVAFVAIGLGSMMLYSALLSEGWCFQMAIARKISKHRGQQSAQIFIGSVGTLVILLGVYTLFGPHLNKMVSRDAQPNDDLTPGETRTLVVD